MRRFLLTVLILVLIVSLAGALTGMILQYNLLSDQTNNAADLENSLRDTQASRQALEGEVNVLEHANQSLRTQLATREAEVATLEAAVARPPLPTPTPPTRPVTSITAPVEGEQFEERETVVVRWQATNQDRIGRVTFLVDGNAVDETAIEGTPTAEGEFRWVAIGLGEHVLTVTAANTIGAEGRPATVTIEVLPVPEPEPEPSLEEENRGVMDGIETVVIGLRGLEPLQPVTRTLYTQAELSDYVVQELDQDYPADEARRDALEMAAFDFLPADTDLRELIEALYTEQIAGFYDSDTGSLAVISDEEALRPLDKTTYAHEFTHALQDQHYGLEALDPEENSDDASLAVTALIEGDAMLVQEQYMLQFLDSDELFEMLSDLTSAEFSVLDSVPAVVREQLMFPYDAGLLFAKRIYQEGGYAALNDVYLHPPLSTEQVLHPDKYLSGELPLEVSLPPLTDTLGSGWGWVDANVLGEFTLRLYLEPHLSARRAAAAAEGWGGDRYAVYHNPESSALVLVMRTIWDSAAEAAEFVDEYRTFGEARFGTAPTETATGACWTGEDAICIYGAGAETLIIRAPTGALIEELETAFPGF
jgi:hypothetical protein